jgi:hypothetical protein
MNATTAFSSTSFTVPICGHAVAGASKAIARTHYGLLSSGILAQRAQPTSQESRSQRLGFLEHVRVPAPR